MPVEVGERRLVLVEGLRGLAEHETAVVLAAGEVAALAVRRGAPHGLDREGRSGLGEPAGQPRVGRGAEVVGVGDEDALVAGGQQVVEQAGADQRGVDVAVARRAPLEIGVLGPADRGEVLGQELGLLVLQELQRQARDREVVVAGDGRHRVLGGAEAVHEDQRQRRLVRLTQVQHLAADDVEEAHPLAHAQQRLGAVHAHRGAEAAVELDDGGGADRGLRGLVVDGDVGQRLHVDRVDRRLGDHPRLTVLEEPVVVGERLDRHLVDAFGDHLVARGLQARGTHDSIVGSSRAARASSPTW